MKAFTKSENGWNLTEDQNAILDAEECVFAETIEEAAEYINVYYNKHYPDFDIVYVDNSWQYKGKRIAFSTNPILRDNVTTERAIQLIKEKGRIYVNNGNKLKEEWFNELKIPLVKLGIISLYDSFKYDPKKAKAIIKNANRKPSPPKKNFIRMYEIRNAGYGMRSTMNIAIIVKSQYLNIETQRSYGNKTKKLVCREFISLKNLFNSFFGKNSHRHTQSFQKLKNTWKKEKPKSAEAIGVTEKFFDFMEEEVKKRKPRKKELKIKWK